MKAINTKEIVKIVNKEHEVESQIERAKRVLATRKDLGEKEVAQMEDKIVALEEESNELFYQRKDAQANLITAIEEAEGRARERVLYASEAIAVLLKVEDWLGLKKKDLEGVSVTINVHAQEFPRAYKWKPEATIFSATYKSGSWRITKIWRDDCRRYPKVMVTHTEQSKKAIVEKYSEM